MCNLRCYNTLCSIKMSAIYILSDERHPEDGYKVGSHTGTINKLKSRYMTTLPKVIIHYFIKCDNAKSVECTFKLMYRNRRVVNNNGNISEWVLAPLCEIFATLLLLVTTYQTHISDDQHTIMIDSHITLSTPSIAPVLNTTVVISGNLPETQMSTLPPAMQFVKSLKDGSIYLGINNTDQDLINRHQHGSIYFDNIHKDKYNVSKQLFYEFYLKWCNTKNIFNPGRNNYFHKDIKNELGEIRPYSKPRCYIISRDWFRIVPN